MWPKVNVASGERPAGGGVGAPVENALAALGMLKRISLHHLPPDPISEHQSYLKYDMCVRKVDKRKYQKSETTV